MKHRSVRVALLCLVAVAVLTTVAVPVQARNPNPGVFPPQAKPFGLSYGEWANRYYQWLAVIPTAESAITDPTGARAAVGQTGKVWFLTTTNDWQDVEGGVYSSAERSITVPNGKGLFLPLNLWWQNIPIGFPELSEADLRAGAEWGIAHVTGLSATVDGRELSDLFAYEIISPLFDLWWIEDNVIFMENDPEGDPAWWADNPTPTVISGFGLILAPLSVGHHEIKWRYESTYTEAEDGFDFEGDQDVIYHITVTPRSH